MCSTAVYLGPSLPRETARGVLEAVYLPPIRRGDLERLPSHVKVVAIVDGEFYQSLAVSPKEILRVMERGIAVYGASSMGALRATELHTYGMIGVGEIFRLYKDEVIDGDDEVAQTYDPRTFAPYSEPLVNIRYALAAGVEARLISRSFADRLVRQIKDVYFPDRSYQCVSQLCPELREFLKHPPNLKQLDTLQLLHILRDRQLP
jgi:hypothetical protein